MNRLKLNPIKRVLLKRMLRDLFFEYEDILLRRDGSVRFREKWWKFWRTERTSAFELCMVDIPQRLNDIQRRYNSDSDAAVDIATNLALDPELDIIGYLWDVSRYIIFPLPGVSVVSKHIRNWQNNTVVQDGKTISVQEVLSSHGNPADALDMPPAPSFNLGNVASLIKKVNYWQIKRPKLKGHDPFKHMIFPIPKVTLVRLV